MTIHNEVADLLDGAADIIERDGWCQKALERDGAVCALGALNKAALGDAYGLLSSHPNGLLAFGALFRRVGMLHLWNNEPERTKQEVLDEFRKAAKHERAAADGIDLGGAS
jgi:hypothetical protein